MRILAGHPLIHYAIRCATLSTSLDDIVVSSEDEEILQLANESGLNNIYRRPSNLSTDSASKWLVWKDLVKRYENSNAVEIDYLVDLDVTAPLRKPHHVNACVTEAIQHNREVVITSYPSDRNPYFNMMEPDLDGYWRLVSQPSSPIVCRQEAPKVVSLSPAVYVCSRDALYSYQHWSEAKCTLVEIEKSEAIDIDTELDLRFVEFLVENNISELIS
jgi:N-acylneuraminate cytidylyltransferase/CMP-N,N'-diacetyllegionaminic acid synthase